MLSLLLLACTPQPDVAAEMQRAIRGSEHALDASLLAAEVFWWAEAPETVTRRHGETCGCPCRERAGEQSLLLDYALDGCVPDSGLVPDELLGHITLLADGNRYVPVLDGLDWEPATPARGAGRSPVTTDLVGRWIDQTLRLDGSLVWNDSFAELTVDAVPGPDGLRLDGSVRGPEAWVTLDAVHLPWSDLKGRCPRADAGELRVLADSEPVLIEPTGDGAVVVAWRGETSAPTDPCDLL